MEVKSVKNYLNIIDRMILRSIDKQEGIEILEDVRYYIIWKYIINYDDEKIVNALAIFSQINSIMEQFYLYKEWAFNPLYQDLRKHIMTWLRETDTKLEVDNH